MSKAWPVVALALCCAELAVATPSGSGPPVSAGQVAGAQGANVFSAKDPAAAPSPVTGPRSDAGGDAEGQSGLTSEVEPVAPAAGAVAAAPAPERSAGSLGSRPAEVVELSYSSVPDGHRDTIVRRLKVIEALVARHGRAYDYRVVTTRNLEQVLGELDSQAAARAKAQGSRRPPSQRKAPATP